MDEVYDLRKHTHCIAFHIGKSDVGILSYSTTTRKAHPSNMYKRNITRYDSRITYDNERLDVLSWGNDSFKENIFKGILSQEFNEKTQMIDVSRKRLYRLFEKGKDNWDQDDLFLFTAVSDFFRLATKEIINEPKEKVKDSDALHYVIIVPSEWEEEIREVLIRPIFVQAGLISKDAQQDRLLFCSDVESIYNHLKNPRILNLLTIGRNAVLGRLVTVEKSKVLIKLDLISTENSLFDFSGSIMFPKVMKSNSISLNSSDVKNGIRDFIKNNFSFDAQEETIRNIMEEIDNNTTYKLNYEDDTVYIKEPFIIDEIISELDKHQKELLKSIRPIDICMEISKHLPNNLKHLLPNNLTKNYSITKVVDKYTSVIESDKGLIRWSRYILEYNRISFGSNNIVCETYSDIFVRDSVIIYGAILFVFNAIQNSDTYCKPRILPTECSSSIFLNSKPDAIMNIAISLKLTELSFSFLDENGLVKELWNHDYFVPYLSLRSLGSFFSFSRVISLNVKKPFISFVNKYFSNESNISSSQINEDMMVEIGNILNVRRHNTDSLVSTQQQVYIKAFVQIYWIYINYILSKKLSITTRSNDNLKIGYAIVIENMLLNNLFGTEDNLKDIIYSSNLVRKEDSYKKLRIFTHDEELLPVIRQSLNLKFRLKSFFVVAQLNEDYVRLAVNQVVTEPDLDNDNPEAIIVQEEILSIPNLYESLCFKMWSNIVEDSSLIQLCDAHKEYNDIELQELFSSESQAEFTNNLKEYISRDILHKELTLQKTDMSNIYLSKSCKCKVCLTLNDITEISFRPVLQDIIPLLVTSLKNNQLFGNYRDIQYIFHLIQFNYNPQFQLILIKILNDEIDHFLYDQRMEIANYTIPKLSNQLFQPIFQQEPFSYKAFKLGVLHQVYSESYGFGFPEETSLFKDKISDTKTIRTDDKTVFPFFKRGAKISKSQINRVFYMDLEYEPFSFHFIITYFKLKKKEILKFREIIHVDDTLEIIEGSVFDNIGIYRGKCVSFILSIDYRGYMPSLSLVLTCKGEGIKKENITDLPEPMTLTRF